MTQNEIRQSFLDFFKNKKHKIIDSASLIPQSDPTLIFTNAGMNQFKDIFLGLKTAEQTRIANSQKCIRVSGKHNDLEDVGFDTYHHTFFEMLGNWSFGDYYKKEAIEWAWELLTEVWNLPKDKLYATVYKDDDEAFELWSKVTDIDKKKILRFNEKDNFWEMGETGPCGPCSEIHIDLGPELDSDPKAWVNSGSPRYIEIWNLVFIQYNRLPDKSLEELPLKHVDTGMGFERIVSILQGKTSNYDSDVFSPIIQEIESLTKNKYSDNENRIPIRVISDHIRTILFSVSDGVIPSNEGRGYIIRRILRRAVRYGKKLGIEGPFLYKLTETVIQHMGNAYPGLKKNIKYINKVIFSEEENFFKTLDRGIAIFTDITDKLASTGEKTIPGSDVFNLYDTYGFPPDLTRLMAAEIKLNIDEKGYETEMEAQKTKARNARGKNEYNLYNLLKQIKNPTKYTGDQESKGVGKIIQIIKADSITDFINKGDQAILILDQTIFYGESGGQIGDTGHINCGSNIFKVSNTIKDHDFILHIGEVTEGVFSVNDNCSLTYPEKIRQAVRRNHTATHLLQKALTETLGSHIKQSGSLVNDKKLRFDFNHFQALTKDEIAKIEQIVNTAVLEAYPVNIQLLDKDTAMKQGAKAFFEEKYGDTVRVVTIGDKYSTELCGGSHIANSSEICLFKIISESSSASGIRRIEAVTGNEALKLTIEDKKLLDKVMDKLSCNEKSRITERISNLVEEIKELKKGSTQKQNLEVHNVIKSVKPENLGKINLIYKEFDNADIKKLREEIDNLKNQHSKLITFFSNNNNNKSIFLCGITDDITGDFSAGNIVKQAAILCGGNGGGRPDFAQAGAKDQTKIKEVYPLIKKIIIEKN